MKYLSLIIIFINLFIYQASAQNTLKTDIDIFKVKYLEIKEIPDHIGDTVCVYGRLHDFKAIGSQNIIIARIDSVSNHKPVTVEFIYTYPETKQYILKQLKDTTIIIYGIVAGNHDKPKVISSFFSPEDGSGTWPSYFKNIIKMQRDTSKRSKVRITSVRLLPPDPANMKKENYKHFSAKLNKKIWYCDLVSGTKLSANKTLTELYLSDSTLTILIKDNVTGKFKVVPQTAFLNRQICVKGRVIAYKGKFAVNITNPKQIELLPDH
ncbi:hypothetical protein SAMN05428975_1883 [Mucilaginibacter sp. OK268]|uniref:hypothetical protein n=1 Tax=Mucilaginibacter sp. OK268 TaxID=1881048 RepID=UPI0008802449|nr:hypothetical protein [Mucilaginibacter sp. OK268]SDP57585.1 hypothetical protein SAMN05428975_1883 [Mucilaginibacter sp. OK268]